MSKRLYVGNLPYSTTADDLRQLFGADVTDAVVINDRDTGRSKGFGFVTLATEEAGQAAIDSFNDHDLGGRRLRVNEAHEREHRPRDSGGHNHPPEPRGDDGRERKDRKRQRRQHDHRDSWE